MTISFFNPEVSGRAFILEALRPARQAAAASVRAAEAPDVTMPASAPVASAITRLAVSCRSSIRTKHFAASCMACSTSGAIRQPPTLVL
jgi:hypothetical protein